MLLEQLNRQNTFDGILILECYKPEMTADIPLIIRSSDKRDAPGENRYILFYDNAMDQIVRHLAGLGHREIGFLGETNTWDVRDEFCDAMRKQKLPVNPDLIYTSAQRFDRIGHEGVQTLHRRGMMPTAIVCAYDDVALGAIEELEQLGYRVPEHVSVVGINNIQYAAHFKPPLTTVQVDETLFIESIMKVIQSAIIEEKDCPHVYHIPAELIVRGSTARPFSDDR